MASPNKFMQTWNSFAAMLLRSPLHGLLSGNTMLITVTGRKSGRCYTTPVNYLRDGNVLYVTSTRERSWWRNLCGGALVSLRLRGKTVPGYGRVIEDDTGTAAAFAAYFRIRPGYAPRFGVALDKNGQPDSAGLLRVVETRVMVQVKLEA